MSAWLSSGTRIALVALLGVTSLALAFALIYIRRLRRARGQRTLQRLPLVAPPPPMPIALGVRTALAAARPRELGGATAGNLALATTPVSSAGSSRMGCPACRREFDPGARFCTYDARRLVAAAEVAAKGKIPGNVCPRCRRVFEAGIRTCAYDAEELLSTTLWEATHGKKAGSPTGVVAKICPQCAVRYDLVMSFCARDGAELMTIN